MVNDGMHVAAVSLSCAFELKAKFSPLSQLSSFIIETNRTTKKMRREGQGSRVVLKESKEKQLAALKSVVRCAEDHQLDRAKLLCRGQLSSSSWGWNVDEKIAILKKDLSEIQKAEPASKRKASDEEAVSLKKLKSLKKKSPPAYHCDTKALSNISGKELAAA
ncbi:protein FRIGIDA-like [Tasmannia lanceolata]|uniref:protein FRIGIDA-like n=2 Tax=Tasmannia lanceolata TaxID=3420 RepID=UPI004064BA82